MSIVIENYISSLGFRGEIGPEVKFFQNWANPPQNSKNAKKLSQYYDGFSDFSDEMLGEYIVF